MGEIITLTTDFGTEDAYVAEMKGVILSINPKAAIVDICHYIKPQNIAQAAFVISTACRYFPQDSIHVVVVDPGVGSQRRAIALKTAKAFFVAPDNGLLSYIANSFERDRDTAFPFSSHTEERGLSAEFQSVSLTNPRFWHHPVSSTFHGRDVFAPVAAHLSLGVSLDKFGEVIPSIQAFPVPHPRVKAPGEVAGHIIHIDHFGNLITDIKKEDLPGEEILLTVAGQQIEGLSTSYAGSNKLMTIMGSTGHLEIALKKGSAASWLGVEIGDIVKVKKRPLAL